MVEFEISCPEAEQVISIYCLVNTMAKNVFQ
jgi:hypothetical protein